ncbi:signal element on autosome protein 2 [Drosophila ficusphila]|uniref:signal element on autosome protein 2 n=1 Tax=Drosophila ficusphila TaxID=30025 RepID=UPI001C89B7DE|nr:signal element on autosome protein 2 [Drosophila ficusphila]
MMENTGSSDAQPHLTGLPPLPKSLSAASSAPVAIGPHPRTASPASSVSALTAAAGELYLGPSTSSSAAAARNRSYNGHGHGQRHGSLSSTQESLSDRESVHSRASSTHSAGAGHTPTNSSSSTGASSSTIDNQLAILRREMYGLRQLDLSLLSQLWALNESIQGFRVFLQEQDAMSPPSRSRTPSDANSLSSDEEDDGSYAPVALPKMTDAAGSASAGVVSSRAMASPAASGGLPTKLATGSTTSHASTSSTSGASGSSSAASSMGKHQQLQQQQQQQQATNHYHQRPAPPPAPPAQHKAHPQLPRILQQRMRQAPPPPPPTRQKGGGGGGGGGASTSSSNHSISSVTQPHPHSLQHPQHTHHSRPV